MTYFALGETLMPNGIFKNSQMKTRFMECLFKLMFSQAGGILTYISSFVCVQMCVCMSVCDITCFWEQTDTILCCFCCSCVHVIRSLFPSVVSTGVSLATVTVVSSGFPVMTPWLLSCTGHISCQVSDG